MILVFDVGNTNIVLGVLIKIAGYQLADRN